LQNVFKISLENWCLRKTSWNFKWTAYEHMAWNLPLALEASVVVFEGSPWPIHPFFCDLSDPQEWDMALFSWQWLSDTPWF
jgi:hypothetical protein